MEVGADGVVCVKDAGELRECIDRTLAFKPSQVEAVVNELSERLAEEEFMRTACSALQDHQVRFWSSFFSNGSGFLHGFQFCSPYKRKR